MLRTHLPPSFLKARKQGRVRFAQRAHSSLELTLHFAETVVDQLLVLQVIRDGAIYLRERYRWKGMDDLFGSSAFMEVSDNRVEPDASACDPKRTVPLFEVG